MNDNEYRVRQIYRDGNEAVAVYHCRDDAMYAAESMAQGRNVDDRTTTIEVEHWTGDDNDPEVGVLARWDWTEAMGRDQSGGFVGGPVNAGCLSSRAITPGDR